MKQGARDSHQRVAFLHLFGEEFSFADQTEIQVVPTGAWKHPAYGDMEITSKTISEFVKSFKEGVRLRIPITAGHDNGMNGGELPAVGWFTDLIDKGVNGLYAFVEWTEEGKRLLATKAFKYFSPEFYEEYSDPQTGEKRGHVLVGGALTETASAMAVYVSSVLRTLSEAVTANATLIKSEGRVLYSPAPPTRRLPDGRLHLLALPTSYEPQNASEQGYWPLFP